MEKHIKSFIKNMQKDEDLVGWGLEIVSQRYDPDTKEVFMVARPTMTYKVKEVFQDYMRWLVKQKDPIIEELRAGLSEELLAEFNQLFLEDNYEEILRKAEYVILVNWLIYRIDNNIDIFEDASFVYSINTTKSNILTMEMLSKLRELLLKGV